MIAQAFDLLARYFDKIPLLNKLKGARTLIGLAGLVVVHVLQSQGIGDVKLMSEVHTGLLAFTGLALLAKGRE
ncbi:MAG: hypothetical protein UY96_C0037G0005 [Parcubacteria group bacterium GW2011_GWB1_56_8]|nr:MAG: hypothetical protein UY96_C0037G0005 [Parcubacteria group bacterium GW2011_GWB1_56_8]